MIQCNSGRYRVDRSITFQYALWPANQTIFYARQHNMLRAYNATPIPSVRLSVCPSVRLSVTRLYCIKTAEPIIEILSPSDRPIILIFRHQGSLRKSDGFTPNAKYKGVAIFEQYAAISQKR